MRIIILTLALAGLTLLDALMSSTNAQEVGRPANAVTVFAARMTGNNVEDFFAPTDIRLRDAYFAGAGYSRRAVTLFDHLELECLGQVARHFGDGHQGDQWEFDVAIGARWTHFPWNHTVATSIALDVGPSYETGRQRDEEAVNGHTERWLAFWVGELEVGPPESLWSAVARIHHRSTGFGLFGKTGGSNSLALGIRRKF